ncbi:MAG: biosynthetic peptidoglycan transglycosylase [Bradymonadia bacterium]|jgi:hypothetical protein
MRNTKSTSSKKFIIIIAIFCSLSLIAIVTWYLVLPPIIENSINNELAKTTEKLQRNVKVQGIALNSPWSVGIEQISLFDPKSEEIGVNCKQIQAKFRELPLSRKHIKFKQIEIESCELWYRTVEDRTNFDDIIEKLKPREKSLPSAEKKISALQRMLSPLPQIKLNKLWIHMQPVQLRHSFAFAIHELSEILLTQDDEKYYKLNAIVDYQSIIQNKDRRDSARISASIKSAKEGKILFEHVDAQAQTPLISLDLGDSKLELQKLALQLPNTLIFSDLSLLQSASPMLVCDNFAMRFLAMPPKKVSGVYFKELEAENLQLNINLNDAGRTNLEDFLDELKTVLLTERDALPNNVEKKERSIEDYFISQRFFLHNAGFSFMDERKNNTSLIDLQNINLELGYRSIKKDINLLLEVATRAPLQMQSSLRADYNMLGEQLFLELDLKESGELTKLTELFDSLITHTYLSQKKSLIEDIHFAKKLLNNFQLQNSEIDANIRAEHKLKSGETQATLSIDARNFVLATEALAELPVEFDFNSQWNLRMDEENIELSTKSAKLNQIPFIFSLSSQTLADSTKEAGDRSFKLLLELPEQNAQSLLDSIPMAVRSSIDGLECTGNISYSIRAEGLLSQIQNMKLDVSLKTSPEFSITRFPVGRSILALNTGFAHDIVDPNAIMPHKINIPPSIYPVVVMQEQIYTPSLSADDIRTHYHDWVLFEDLNPYLIQLITTTEDGSFFTHNGFSLLQIKAALAKNLAQNSFSRGASTITMQLVKNIFFDRSKSIARKFQEALYTWLVESVYRIPKQRLMEIYFNVIEFGPEVYGIQAAARYYFGKQSADLSLKECAYLMSIIPKPRSGALHRAQNAVSASNEKTIRWFIDEMLRRKCAPDVIQKTRERYEKRGTPVPFQPCCPAKAYVESLKAQALQFYVPESESAPAYRPDLYDENGEIYVPSQRLCGFSHDSTSIFEEWLPEVEELPSADQLQ